MPVSILSVSCDENLLLTRQLLLQTAGYEVTSALGYTAALMHCRNASFDVMVLGHSLPGLKSAP
jgi:DNA-binding response OmpR family regulator